MTQAVAPDTPTMMRNLSKEVLLLHWKDLPAEDAERLLSVLPQALSRVFTNEVVSRLEQNCQLEECILQGSLGPLHVARTVLEKLAAGGFVQPNTPETVLQNCTQPPSQLPKEI